MAEEAIKRSRGTAQFVGPEGNLYMHIRIYTSMYGYIHVQMNGCINQYICIEIYIYICTYTHISLSLCMCRRTYTYIHY